MLAAEIFRLVDDKSVILKWPNWPVAWTNALMILLLALNQPGPHGATGQQQQPTAGIFIADPNSIEHDHMGLGGMSLKHIPCGTIAANHTRLIVRNPHYPEPTYVKAICETVVERRRHTINRLTIKFKQLELYRPNYDGSCLHDRFAVYTDLNVAVSPILCGNQTGHSISVPFLPPLSSLIVSVTTSDLDHDRAWVLEIEQH